MLMTAADYRDSLGKYSPRVFANVGKLMMTTQIYGMHRLAYGVSGRTVVALPGPDEDHNPETRGDLMAILGTRPVLPYEARAEVMRFMNDLTASDTACWMSATRCRSSRGAAARWGARCRRRRNWGAVSGCRLPIWRRSNPPPPQGGREAYSGEIRSGIQWNARKF